MLPSPTQRLTQFSASLVLALILFTLACARAQTLAGTGAATHKFDIPAGEAAETLRRAAQQAGREIVFPADVVRGVRTNAVQGEFTVRAALDRMLAGTPLAVVEDEQTGALAVVPRKQRENPRAEPAGSSAMSANPATGSAARGGADEETVVLSPFEVSAAGDRGYRAANSVSATRIAVPISDLPMNVSAFTEEFIQDQHAYDLYDIVRYAGVHQDNVSQSGWVRYNLRGFTDTAIQRNGFRTNFRFIDTANIARVEVVKGPASLMYGQINPGGVINYVTKRPQEKQQILLTGSIGTHEYSRAVIDATGSVPGSNEKVLYRAIGMYENIQQFSQLAEGYKTMLAPSVTWRISPNVTLNVDYERFERREPRTPSSLLIVYVNGKATLPYPGLPRNFSFTGLNDYQRFTSEALTGELNVRISDHLQLRAIYEQSEWDMWARITGQAGTGILTQAVIDQFYPAGSVPPQHAMFRRNRLDQHEGDESTGQIEMAGKYEWFGITVQPLVGYRETFHADTRTRLATNTSLAPWDMRNPATWNREVPFGLDALTPSSDTSGFTDNNSIYGVLSLSLLRDRLKLLGGYSRYEVHNAPSRNNLRNIPTSPDSVRKANVPQVGALYKFTPELSAFASYSESFIANTSLLRVSNVPTTPAVPSIGKGYEGGLKLDLLDGRISGTLSVFRLTVNPTSVFEVFGGTDPNNGTPLFTDVQGGEQESKGYEADLLFTIVPGLQLYVNYTNTDATYSKHPTDPTLTGSRLVGTPDQTFNAWGKYTFQNGPLKNLYFGGGLSYTGGFVSQAANPFVSMMPSYTTVDFVAGYTFDRWGRPWTVDLTIKNIADKFYYASASSFGAPRHGFLSVSTKF